MSKLKGFKKKQKGKTNGGFSLTVYELNKIAYAQMPVPEKGSDEYSHLLATLTSYLALHQDVKYFMLLNDELRYYTIFHINEDANEVIHGVLQECLENVGDLIDVDFNEATDACECWVKNNNQVSMFVFFVYDMGVIECRV